MDAAIEIAIWVGLVYLTFLSVKLWLMSRAVQRQISDARLRAEECSKPKQTNKHHEETNGRNGGAR